MGHPTRCILACVRGWCQSNVLLGRSVVAFGDIFGECCLSYKGTVNHYWLIGTEQSLLVINCSSLVTMCQTLTGSSKTSFQSMIEKVGKE